jgi:hypothetical protein
MPIDSATNKPPPPDTSSPGGGVGGPPSANSNTDTGLLDAASNQAVSIQSKILQHNLVIAPIMGAKTVSEDGKK